jgi:hypothetical protein
MAWSAVTVCPVSSTTSSRNARQSGGQPNRAALATNRLPTTRERRPALAALAVILILLGAAGSALIALRSGERVGYLTVSKEIAPGHKLVRGDFGSGQIAGDTAGLIKAADVKDFIGDYAKTRLYKDQFVTSSMFSDTPDVPEKGALVGVSLEGGQVPSEGLQSGDIVRVIKVPVGGTDGTPPEVLVGAAEVTKVQDDNDKNKSSVNTNQVVNATVLVPSDRSTAVAAAAAAKNLVLIKLAPGTKPEIARGGGR